MNERNNDERAAFDEFWRERCTRSWTLTLASDERDKPVPPGWGGAFKRESWEAFRAGRASLCAPHAGMTDEDRAILEAVYREMDEGDGSNAPGHCHDAPGIWDSDNGALAGKPCAWCLTWAKFTKIIERDRAILSASAAPTQTDEELQQMERETMGDPILQTGIYDPANYPAAQPGVMQQWREEAIALAQEWAIQSYYKGGSRPCDIDSARAAFCAHLSAVPTDGGQQ